MRLQASTFLTRSEKELEGESTSTTMIGSRLASLDSLSGSGTGHHQIRKPELSMLLSNLLYIFSKDSASV